MERLVVERSIWIGAPRERVWLAVTEPEQLAQWFLPPALGAQLKRGDDGKLIILMGEMGVELAIIEGMEPPRRVSGRSLPERLITTTYALDEENGGTRVTVTMTGFEALPEVAARERLAPSGAAWEKALENLKAYLGGAGLPHPQGMVAALFGYRREALKQLAVERSIWIAAPRERVWQALTDPKQIQQWFSPGTEWRASGLEAGSRLSVISPETGEETHAQIIDAVEPPRHLVTHSAPPEVPHVTTWTLEEENEGTRLTLTYSGYELEPDAGRHDNMEQNAFGFGMLLENLQAMVEGRALPYPWGF